MAARPSPAGSDGADESDATGAATRRDHDELVRELNSRVHRQARRVRLRRTARELAEKVPDEALDAFFEFLQGLLP
jgi:hypothetical protein